MGSNKNQLVKAIQEAEAYDGPSIVIAYAPCINHGINMHETQAGRAESGRYRLLDSLPPQPDAEGRRQESVHPSIRKNRRSTWKSFLEGEKRYTTLKQTFPDKVEGYWDHVVQFVNERYLKYKKMSEE